MSRPQGDSIWGNINTCIEIGINIYYIYAEYGEGIMVPTDEKTGLSENALTMGEKKDGYICFDETTKDIPMYEILQKRMSIIKKSEHLVLQQMKEIERDGKISLTDYFGECSPPHDGKDKVRNGIYMTKDSAGERFAVHDAIADNYLSPFAIEFGRKQGEYLYYDTTTAAIPISELSTLFTEVEGLVISKDSLNATLHNNFPMYVSLYNSIVPEESQIPQAEAPTALFLSSQITEEADKMRTKDTHAPQEVGQDDEYGEVVSDYGFEP